jgi:ferredoxin
MMAAAAQAAGEWPTGTVHFEYFSTSTEPTAEEDRPFRVRLARSGGEYEVPAGETIVDVLRRHGIAIRTSCELGYCALA